MRKTALILLGLYAVAMLWLGTEARAHYDATVPIVSAAHPETALISLGSVGIEQLWYPCIPAQAIRWDGASPCVAVIDERPGYFGLELFARQVPVKLLSDAAASDENLVALQDGALGSGQLVIVSSNKPIENGAVVRLIGSDENGTSPQLQELP